MKIRKGFVSNSSSSSFVLAFPKDSPVELKNIEDYFGGFSDDLAPEVKDSFAFEVWASQYFDSEGNRKTGNKYALEDSGEYTHYSCTAGWTYIRENRGLTCDGHFDKADDDVDLLVPDVCKRCQYLHTEKRRERDDDYYYVLDNSYSDDLKKWLEKHKNYRIIELEIDDNEPPRRLSWGIANEITSNAYSMFKSNNKAYTSGGK